MDNLIIFFSHGKRKRKREFLHLIPETNRKHQLSGSCVNLQHLLRYSNEAEIPEDQGMEVAGYNPCIRISITNVAQILDHYYNENTSKEELRNFG